MSDTIPAGSSLITARDSLLRLQLIGTVVSAIAYGFIVSLFLHCLALLVGNKKNSYTHRTRMFLIIYVVVMFLLSTVALVQSSVYITRAFFYGVDRASNLLTQTNEPLSLPIAVWGADGFMLWRCWVLYQNAPWFGRRPLCLVLMLLVSLASIGSGMLYYLTPQLATSALISPLTPILITISITTFVNFVLAGLIAGRLLYHQETMRRILGPQYGSPYMRVIVMCVESCFLIVVTCGAYVILFVRGNAATFNGCIIPLLLIPHICVISPLIIVYQVAKGRAVTTLRPSHVITPNIGDNVDMTMSKPVGFNHSLSSTTSEEVITPHEEECHTKMRSTTSLSQSPV
ncbi:hypothetical protein BDZ97DRAFT_1811174 [Flammula alnicola]|nr:hypothetical protein BDZ97DRAFT_1811174 [Flammula alnicola]